MIRPAALLACVALLAVPTVASSQANDTILPGYWEYNSKVSFGLSSTSVEKKCVEPKDIEKFFSGPSNRHYKCVYPVRTVANGKANFQGTCTDKRGRKAYVTASGTYSPKRFTLNAKIKTSIIGMNITPTGTIDARYLGPTCPPKPPKKPKK
ncbi:DUF3617 family protein [Caulobacter sp. SLTY]|uniref:DUF3617 domain-containing protein n=1 Tax=Caulobacter sp. SLTY TaxID=2683262 RepID=UPI0014120847|nr:DUF3617 family protein [Caulobacter sp. SLTY]NBB17252.1 DUF3617 family protein [Caulobacter sp. SLTY]